MALAIGPSCAARHDRAKFWLCGGVMLTAGKPIFFTACARGHSTAFPSLRYLRPERRNARLFAMPMFAGDRGLGVRILEREKEDAPNCHRGYHRPSRRHRRDLGCHRYLREFAKTGHRGSSLDFNRRDADDEGREEPSRSAVRRALTRGGGPARSPLTHANSSYGRVGARP